MLTKIPYPNRFKGLRPDTEAYSTSVTTKVRIPKASVKYRALTFGSEPSENLLPWGCEVFIGILHHMSMSKKFRTHSQLAYRWYYGSIPIKDTNQIALSRRKSRPCGFDLD